MPFDCFSAMWQGATLLLADREVGLPNADLEVGDTAGLEARATY
jgi:hypothetical protein